MTTSKHLNAIHGYLPLTIKACLQSLSLLNNTLRDYKSYFFSCYDKIFVTMIRKLGGLLNNHSDYLTFNYEKEKSVMVMVFNSHFMLSISWF